MANREKYVDSARRTTKKPNKSGQFRVIGGQWKGRKLKFFEVEGLRPSLDRVRETLFNWLQSDIHGARCLDLFAGSGAVGIEALSRGAASVDFVELNKKAARQLESNLGLLGAEMGSLMHQDAKQFLLQEHQPYDIVFLDPPFHQGLAQEVVSKLAQTNLLKEEALIYLEIEQKLEVELPENWQLLKDKKAGQLQYRLYRVS
ncbi:16S rRNA (guanine(966)-N(2))-methyltransferase RsmD [Kangiella geojedonensis]|uniref:Ribosomal RNA small subunit methyltransferase D n=1 Tax=Kangiella geojedonensis TaxID=914150 RepID=A0A0F6TS40_9GAMM|nr:16S rRNA (guanine(966)-N(2))-methyltransferase RsmD [Kangiella geojedonensis]AKE53129.1 Ribosomal RNA small subunit methyltransferase D [Kangiella geojedonensis]